jgi:hypothetical protein
MNELAFKRDATCILLGSAGEQISNWYLCRNFEIFSIFMMESNRNSSSAGAISDNSEMVKRCFEIPIEYQAEINIDRGALSIDPAWNHGPIRQWAIHVLLNVVREFRGAVSITNGYEFGKVHSFASDFDFGNPNRPPIPIHKDKYCGSARLVGRFEAQRRIPIAQHKCGLFPLLVELSINPVRANSRRDKAHPSSRRREPVLNGAVFRLADIALNIFGKVRPETDQQDSSSQRQKRQNRHVKPIVVFHRIAPVRQNLTSALSVYNGRVA